MEIIDLFFLHSLKNDSLRVFSSIWSLISARNLSAIHEHGIKQRKDMNFSGGSFYHLDKVLITYIGKLSSKDSYLGVFPKLISLHRFFIMITLAQKF